VSPAFIETNTTDGMMEKRADENGTDVDDVVESFLAEERPHLVLDRRCKPDEVAAVIAFLCSDRASFVVGSTYRVDGAVCSSSRCSRRPRLRRCRSATGTERCATSVSRR